MGDWFHLLEMIIQAGLPLVGVFVGTYIQKYVTDAGKLQADIAAWNLRYRHQNVEQPDGRYSPTDPQEAFAVDYFGTIDFFNEKPRTIGLRNLRIQFLGEDHQFSNAFSNDVFVLNEANIPTKISVVNLPATEFFQFRFQGGWHTEEMLAKVRQTKYIYLTGRTPGKKYDDFKLLLATLDQGRPTTNE